MEVLSKTPKLDPNLFLERYFGITMQVQNSADYYYYYYRLQEPKTFAINLRVITLHWYCRIVYLLQHTTMQ